MEQNPFNTASDKGGMGTTNTGNYRTHNHGYGNVGYGSNGMVNGGTLAGNMDTNTLINSGMVNERFVDCMINGNPVEFPTTPINQVTPGYHTGLPHGTTYMGGYNYGVQQPMNYQYGLGAAYYQQSAYLANSNSKPFFGMHDFIEDSNSKPFFGMHDFNTNHNIVYETPSTVGSRSVGSTSFTDDFDFTFAEELDFGIFSEFSGPVTPPQPRQFIPTPPIRGFVDQTSRYARKGKSFIDNTFTDGLDKSEASPAPPKPSLNTGFRRQVRHVAIAPKPSASSNIPNPTVPSNAPVAPNRTDPFNFPSFPKGVPSKIAAAARELALINPEAARKLQEIMLSEVVRRALKNEKELSEKIRKAGTDISSQKQETRIEKQLGSDITIVDDVEEGVEVGGVYWFPPRNDKTIPTEQNAIKKCIDTIVDAILNDKDCREKATTRQFANRWKVGATFYKLYEVKAVARDLTELLIDVHMNGWTKPIYDKDQRELYQKTMCFTFEDRFGCVVELLKYSKTTCQDILKGERFYSVVGNPYTLYYRTASNNLSNKMKALRIANATILENPIKPEDNDDEEPMEVAEQTKPTPRFILIPKKYGMGVVQDNIKGKGLKRAHDDDIFNAFDAHPYKKHSKPGDISDDEY